MIAEKPTIARNSQANANDCNEERFKCRIRYGIGVTDIVTISVTPISEPQMKL